MYSLAVRSLQLEIMDEANLSREELVRTFKEIEFINRLTFAYPPTLESIANFHRLKEVGALRILDIGCGGGDMLRQIARYARSRKFKVELTGLDLSPVAREVALERTSKQDAIIYLHGDVFDLENAGAYDVIINSLFMHHLRDHDIVRVLKWMTANAKLGWFINDLHRHPIAFHTIRLATKAGGFGRLVQNDAPLSVARAFRAYEWRRYLLEAGISDKSYVLRWHFPFRYGIECDSALARELAPRSVVRPAEAAL